MSKSTKARHKNSGNRVTLEVVLKPHSALGIQGATLSATETVDPNFSFEITVPEAVKITKINIDGTKIEGEELAALGMAAVNRVLKGTKFVMVVVSKIFFAVEAVGEPNREVFVALKYFGQAVTLTPSKFMIENTGRGLLALENVQLPSILIN